VTPQGDASDVVLRRAEPGDAEGIALTFRSRGLAAGTLQTPYPSLAQWKEKLATSAMKHYVFVALAEEQIIGHAGLHPTGDSPRRAHAWGVGIGVVEAWQGRGVGTRLMETLLDLADHWLGALRLELTVYVDNARAIRMYERLGFVHEGTHRAFALRDGVYVDCHAMARLHPNPPRLPSAG
jgi:putative acetyltransferase